MPILEVKNVSIRYMTGDFKEIGLKEYVMRKLKGRYEVREFWADRDITFSLEKGEMLGIIGTNGAGKSTLLKAVSGIMEPTKGRVVRRGRIAALLELASGFDGELTVRENAYLRGAMLGYTRKFMDETYERIIEFAELKEFEDRPFKQLSSGMKSRLAFAIASLVEPEILILDEVLSVGDGAFRKKSEAKMREIIGGGATTILVSHSIQQVRELCGKVLWLDKGRQVAFGNAQILCGLYQQYLDKSMTLEEAKAAWAAVNEGYDCLVVGAGLYGAAFAREAADRGKRCLVIERRSRIGGRAWGEEDPEGRQVFRTGDREVWEYINRYGKFLPIDNGSGEEYSGVPEEGYEAVARGLLEGISVVTGLSYRSLEEAYPEIAELVVYTGAADELFEYRLGRLEYREGPSGAAEAVEDERNRELYGRYMELAAEERPKVVFGGRLGEHRDYSAAECVAAARRRAAELAEAPGRERQKGAEKE